MAKKIVKFLVGIVILITVLTVFVLIKPSLNKKYKLTNTKMSIKIPYAYSNIENEEENESTILSLYNDVNGITISAVEVKETFWNSGDAKSRVDEYISVLSSANYDSEIKNIKTETIKKDKKEIGRVEAELKKQNTNQKLIAIVTGENVGNVVVEIRGSIEHMERSKEEIEKIISSINF